MESNLTKEKIEHIYIHIPFCLRSCTYCSFFKINYSPKVKEKYIETLLREIDLYQELHQVFPKTIYFGGGTPSLLSGTDVKQILSKFDLFCEEITLEVNPVQINTKFINNFSNTATNRISIGIQSFLDDELVTLGRLHKSNQIKTAIDLLKRNNFENISFDLMYGLPNQSLQDVEYSVKKMLECNPTHFSIYCLSLEEDVPLYATRKQIPSDEIVSDMYNLLRLTLEKNHYTQYEISNFARVGFESKHNLSYWNGKNYLGIGAGASGFIKNMRYKNPENLELYHTNITNKKLFTDHEILSANIHENEYIFLQLRKTKGINLNNFDNEFKTDFLKKYENVIKKYHKFFIISKDSIKLSPKSYFISDELFQDFF
jgi:putative oxygen-independent coproporphyrinogen III oxidase